MAVRNVKEELFTNFGHFTDTDLLQQCLIWPNTCCYQYLKMSDHRHHKSQFSRGSVGVSLSVLFSWKTDV